MNFRYDDLLRFGWVMSPDDQAGGGEAAAETVQTTATETPAVATETPAPTAVSMTREEFDSAIAKASAQALADARAEQAKEAAANQAREAEARRRQAAEAASNPQFDAVEALDIRADLLEEALLLHPEMPLEARKQLKEDLRSFKGIRELRAAKDAGLHIKLADAAAGAALRTGTFVPKSVEGVHREPVHTVVPSAPKIPDSYRAAIKADGLDLTEKELEEAYRIDSQNQRGW